tara:strand:+ start:3120 stop:4013 length:894 start_codon:yes stop_codon:yes gene_type:complete
MAIGATTAAVIGMGVSMYQSNQANKTARRTARNQLEFQKEQAALLEEQKEAYRSLELTNPFADTQNAFAGLGSSFENLAADARNVYAGGKNLYEGMENRFENMPIEQRATDLQIQQGREQRANILQGLRGAAGTSGVAGLAQSLARQGELQAQTISAGIGQQERQNQMLAAQEAARIDQLQRGAGMQLQQMEMAGASEQQKLMLAGAAEARGLGITRQNLIAQGEAAADMARRQGEAALQEAEMSRHATLLGMQYGQSAGANEGYQQALQNQASTALAGQQMTLNAFTNVIGTLPTG